MHSPFHLGFCPGFSQFLLSSDGGNRAVSSWFSPVYYSVAYEASTAGAGQQWVEAEFLGTGLPWALPGFPWLCLPWLSQLAEHLLCCQLPQVIGVGTWLTRRSRTRMRYSIVLWNYRSWVKVLLPPVDVEANLWLFISLWLSVRHCFLRQFTCVRLALACLLGSWLLVLYSKPSEYISLRWYQGINIFSEVFSVSEANRPLPTISSLMHAIATVKEHSCWS